MINENYTIDEILKAVEELNSKSNSESKTPDKISDISIPRDTAKIIEEAEKSLSKFKSN